MRYMKSNTSIGGNNMLTKLKQLRDDYYGRKDGGFTIVEVMIVLAIAGLIILIVFLAVPALQRNSRNTQRKNDVSSLLGGVSEYAASHNGNLTGLTSQKVLDNSKVGYYEGIGTGQGNVDLNTTGAATLTASSPNDRVIVVTKAKCNAANAAVAGPSRGVVALYLIEDTSAAGFAVMCQEG